MSTVVISIAMTVPTTMTIATVRISVAVALRVAMAIAATIAAAVTYTVTPVAPVLTTEATGPITAMLASMVAWGLPLGATSGLLEIVPALGVLVKEWTPAVRQRGLVGGRLVLGLRGCSVVLSWRRGRLMFAVTTVATITTFGAVIAVLGRGRSYAFR